MEGNRLSVLPGDIHETQSSDYMPSDECDARGDGLEGGHGSLAGEPPKAAFHRLPQVVIERILCLVDANCFASLTLLNRAWRRISDSPRLYRHHLADYCSPPGSSAEVLESASLETLKSKLAQIARSHVFAAFLRPKQTVVKLISASVSSSSASPQGEALRFIFSAHGRLLLALSSSRIFVIDLTKDHISVRHELKILRRPTAAAILDDGSLLAVASSGHRVRLYELKDQYARLLQTIELHEVPLSLEFSPYASVLAVAFDGGIEIHALGENILSTAHRAVRCEGVSTLTFSSDGSMLFGSSDDPRANSFIMVSPPLLPDPGFDLSLSELHSRMWTTQILFPEVGEGYSYSNLIPPAESGDQSIFFVGYDNRMKAFRISQVDDIKGGTLYLVGPGADIERDEPRPNLLPVTSGKGEFIATSFEKSGIWIFGVPESRTKPEDSGKDSEARPQPTIPRIDENGSLSHEATNFQRLKKHIEGSKSFIAGHPIEATNDITDMRWMRNVKEESSGSSKLCRLVAVAPGGVDSSFSMITGDTMPIDGGRVILFDFEISPRNGAYEELTIEAGEAVPTELPEQGATLDAEVELEKRRAQISRQRTMAARHAPSRSSWRNSIPPAGSQLDEESTSPPLPSTPGGGARSALPFLDSPYSNTSPRSIETLRRAATAASRSLAASRFETARPALGSGSRRRQFVVPHESDADNWVPPPPPYTEDASDPLPDHFRAGIVPRATEPPPRNPPRDIGHGLRRSRTSTIDSSGSSSLHRSQTTISRPSVTIPRRPLHSNSATNSPINYHDTSPIANVSPPNPVIGGSRQIPNSQGGHSTANINSLPPSRNTPTNTGSTFPLPQVPPTQHPITSTPASFTPLHGHGAPPNPPFQVIGNQGYPPHLATATPSQLQPGRPGGQPAQLDALQRPPYIPSPNAASIAHAPHPEDPLPNVPTLPVQRQISGSSSLPEQPQGDPQSRSGRWLSTNYRSSDNSNSGVQRSRSRSQDVPRRRLNTGGGLFDKRTGRNILTSQSDIRLNSTARSEDWKEQWTKLKGEKKKNKDSKCAVM
ncbi:F-box domain-containing protein [Nannizzia gypsea CBS 118893]|uniref:F-box domain-containing protein n=1 Tax=Arthroderma gypseum (strain ATCC MYA-4604 / CBS 118893) TaxID=535722 RepID=E4UNX7_ARTGP|nr:F-box domain-containing protein [Nannizzia gypsea CBS 118893]EFQ99730.1 F-box domain-containing protein [Nannizzia gypsea CBS 118893]